MRPRFDAYTKSENSDSSVKGRGWFFSLLLFSEPPFLHIMYAGFTASFEARPKSLLQGYAGTQRWNWRKEHRTNATEQARRLRPKAWQTGFVEVQFGLVLSISSFWLLLRVVTARRN